MYNKVTLGFCPIGKFVFSHEDAMLHKALIEKKMKEMDIRYVSIDSVIEDGIIRGNENVDAAVQYLGMQKVDCLFIPHCNFGTESAAGLIAKKLGVPTLLWGPMDKGPLEDGTRLRDSLCEMFASSKVLKKLGVPFTYIENCNIEDDAFEKGLDIFIRVSNVLKKLNGAKIGMIGNRIDFFWSTIVDESDLLQKFGIEVLPVDLAKIIRLTKELASKKRNTYLKEISEISKKLDIFSLTEQGMLHILALRDVLYNFAIDNGLTALAIESFMTLVEELNVCISFSQALISDMGIPCVSESDIHGAVSSIIIEAAGLNMTPSFFADLTIRHPENNSGLLLWHDSFPLSLKDPQCRGSLGSHWILPNFKQGMCHWKLANGDITIMRFDGDGGDYRLLAKKCRTVPGPYTQNTYVWVEMDNWKSFEEKIIYGPYIHHTSCIYGNHERVLEEACKYLKCVEFDKI